MAGGQLEQAVWEEGAREAEAASEHPAHPGMAAQTLEELRIAQKVARLGSWTWDLASDSIEWSAGLYELLGLCGDEPASEELFDRYVHPEDLSIVMDLRREIADGRAVRQREFRVVQDSGTQLILAADVRSERNEAGELVGFRGVVQDVTRRKALEEQLRHSQKMEAVGTLAGGVAHDFNNYLMVISAHVEHLRALSPDSGSLGKSLAAISSACERCATLTNQLLMFSRRRSSMPRPTNLSDLLRRIDPMLRTVLGETNKLTLEIGEPGVHAFIDPSLFEQAIVNMIVNARDAMPDGGEVTIAIDARVLDKVVAGHLDCVGRRCACLRVIDSGVGISESVLERIFEPFFTTKDAGRGTGLGLATTYGIIEEADGCISVESEEGRGTSFTILLPLVEANQSEEVSPPQPTGVRSVMSGRVLVVEDVAQVRDVIAQQLELGGFEVITAEHGRAATKVLSSEKRPIDVVLSDVVMPVMGGIELARHVHEQYPHVRCALMSGYARQTVEAQFKGVPVLHKPFRTEELLALVSDLCQRAAHP